MGSLRLLPWRLYLWVLNVPSNVMQWQQRQQAKIEPEKFKKRQRNSKAIYIVCLIILLACAVLWLLTGGSNPPPSASS